MVKLNKIGYKLVILHIICLLGTQNPKKSNSSINQKNWFYLVKSESKFQLKSTQFLTTWVDWVDLKKIDWLWTLPISTLHRFFLVPPCAPDELSNLRFYNALNGHAWLNNGKNRKKIAVLDFIFLFFYVATSFGHIDFLDEGALSSFVEVSSLEQKKVLNFSSFKFSSSRFFTSVKCLPTMTVRNYIANL